MSSSSSSNSTMFQSTSNDLPSILHVSFANHDVNATLGAQLLNCDTTYKPKNNENDTKEKFMFTPGYAIVNKLIGDSTTVAKQAGIQCGDIIIAVNGLGFRRFAKDYKDEQVQIIKPPPSLSSSTAKQQQQQQQQSSQDDNNTAAKNDDEDNKTEKGTEENETQQQQEEEKEEPSIVVDHRVVSDDGTAYNNLLSKIKEMKSYGGDPPLVLTFERYDWDARPNSWNRFLLARDNNVVDAMRMIQQHEIWKQSMFPIDLVSRGMQKMIREKVICEIDIDTNNDADNKYHRTVYVDYGKLLGMQQEDVPIDEIVKVFIIYTERMLAANATGGDPRNPKTNQFIDLSSVSITGTGFRVDALKQIYGTFEPNYPETLHKMIIYPVSNMLATTARTLLSFVNEKTKKKFVITNNLEEACNELGWNKAEVDECGGITEFLHKHEKSGRSFHFD